MSNQTVEQAIVVSQASIKNNQLATRIALFKADGTPYQADPFVQAAAQADVDVVTSVVAAGANPTKAEYDALRADALATRTVLNSLLAKLRAAGIIDT